MGEWFAGVADDLATEALPPAPGSLGVQWVAEYDAAYAWAARARDPLDLAGPPWWLCPNVPRCPHGQIMHDVEEHIGDGTDTCCAEGCDCRGPAARPVTT